ncbi:Predicted nucleic acid-binding protein, contains PIN domain [Flavobacterium micromati]|uniref:Predicted nucleic acid-binding protein, contains PIN domain n=1 Tax=Flavobacterium micromati TaxID=229205 RepID=A0A1M5FQ06_9FLAO|nr:PIN domain-containing protein [Flavobacterium micromati]SHF93509.1 Predicted nucleic acid-binding protein, contains PIN domain [Flavobacterium micromati]
MENVLIDTDVILDFFFDRQPFAEFAAELFLLCENNEIKGFVTPVIISNVYYLLRKTAKHEIITEKLKQLLTIIDIVEMNKEVVIDALNSKFKDFEDALQNFAASNNGTIQIILTRNIKDFRNSKLAIITPEIYLKNKSN